MQVRLLGQGTPLAARSGMKSIALALVLFGTACATDGTPGPEPEPEPTEPTQHMQTSGPPTLTLFISNQSFDKRVVDIQVSIDGTLAVSGDFNVHSQHSWYKFSFALPAGPHQITAISADGTATLSTAATQRYGVINFWYDAENDEPEHFGFFGSDSEPLFQ